MIITAKQMVLALVSAGMTEQAIADKITASGTTITQSAINKLKSGASKDASFQVGVVLLQLYDDVVARQQQKSAEINAVMART